MSRRWWGIGIALALSLAPLRETAGQAPATPSRAPLNAAWSRPERGVVAVALSPNGERVLSVDRSGNVRCYQRGGALRWERRLPGVDTLAVSRDGQTALAYGHRRPLHPQVHFLDDAGQVIHLLPAEAPVQTAVLSPRGDFAAVTAGRNVYFCGRTRTGMRVRRVALDTEPPQLQLAAGDSAYLLTRARTRLLRIKSDGRLLWSRAIRGTATSISASEDGRFIAVASESHDPAPTPPAAAAALPDRVEVTLLTHQNSIRWTSARPGRAPRVRLSASGATALLSYDHKVEHNRESRYERRLAYLASPDGDGWTIGGGFQAPLPAAVSSGGEWVVALDTRRRKSGPRFRLYGNRGERRSYYDCPAPLLIATASTDGRSIATYRADSVLEVLEVREP